MVRGRTGSFRDIVGPQRDHRSKIGYCSGKVLQEAPLYSPTGLRTTSSYDRPMYHEYLLYPTRSKHPKQSTRATLRGTERIVVPGGGLLSGSTQTIKLGWARRSLISWQTKHGSFTENRYIMDGISPWETFTTVGNLHEGLVSPQVSPVSPPTQHEGLVSPRVFRASPPPSFAST